MARPLHVIDVDMAEMQEKITQAQQQVDAAGAGDVHQWLDLLTERERQMTALRVERNMAVQQQAGERTCALHVLQHGWHVGVGRAHLVVRRFRCGCDAPGCKCIIVMPAIELLTPNSHAALLAGAPLPCLPLSR